MKGCRFLLPLATLVLAGCHFSRDVVNEWVRDLDTSWIEPGVTTREEIVARMGACPSMKEGGGVTADSFRWVCSDTFTARLEIGYIVTPTFERGTRHYAEDVLIRFDREGRVSLVSRTRSDGETNRVVEWREARR